MTQQRHHSLLVQNQTNAILMPYLEHIHIISLGLSSTPVIQKSPNLQVGMTKSANMAVHNVKKAFFLQ